MWYMYGILLSVKQLMLFVSSRWHFWKMCRAVEIRAVAFRAVDPDSKNQLTNFLFTSLRMQNSLIWKLIYIFLLY
jgi:hypothetical protein